MKVNSLLISLTTICILASSFTITTAEGVECDDEHPCEGANGRCNQEYENREYCDYDSLECQPGMSIVK